MPNVFFEISGNRQHYSEGIHVRCNLWNDTKLTYGFAIRGNILLMPPPDDYFGSTSWPDSGLGRESGGIITVSANCQAGLIEDNAIEDRRSVRNESIIVDPLASIIVQRGNRLL